MNRLYKVKPFDPKISEQSKQLLMKVHAVLQRIRTPDYLDFVGITEENPTLATAMPIDTRILWHHRLCHLNFQTAYHMSSNCLVKALSYLPSSREHNCITCVFSKQHRVHKSLKPV